jgi:protoheme IX farnesyltransferase
MSVLSALTAYATAGPGPGTLTATVLGTTLAAAGALSLNQWWERNADGLMARTRGRPLPQGKMTPREALWWSLGFSLIGTTVLAAAVNPLAAALAATTILVYALIYTPLKRRTRWATEVGSVSGALPALLGNAAAGDIGSHSGLVLAAILLFWQMPHFFAIGWRYRVEYRAAGFKVLPATDASGGRTAVTSLAYTIALIVVSLLPWVLGWMGAAYGAIALGAGMWFLQRAWRFHRDRDRDQAARRLFFASLFYLPLMIAALILESTLAAL